MKLERAQVASDFTQFLNWHAQRLVAIGGRGPGRESASELLNAHSALVDLAAKAPTYNFDNGLLVGEIASLLASAGDASEPIHG